MVVGKSQLRKSETTTVEVVGQKQLNFAVVGKSITYRRRCLAETTSVAAVGKHNKNVVFDRSQLCTEDVRLKQQQLRLLVRLN